MAATPKPKPDVDNQIGGDWGDVKDWPLIGLHSIVTQDGKVLTFGTDAQGMQGGQFIYDVYDPETGEHTTLENTTPTDIFCSAAMIIPGTSKILIGGGDGRVGGAYNKGLSDVNVFNSDDLSLKASEVGDMSFARWYPTMVSLPTGQIIILGGRDQDGRGVSTPEIFTPGEGWRKLDGAEDGGIGSNWWYPKAWLSNEGEIVYFASGGRKVMALDPAGSGEVRQIGELPFSVANDASAVMYESGKILIMDNSKNMWTMDINGPEPVFKQTQSLDSDRNWADMTVMADGKILINGGTSKGNSEADANLQAAVWDPETGQITYADAQTQSRLYHSTSVMLADGTILSTGGGAAGSAEVNHLNAEIYKPPYLYDKDGNLADRPLITGAPEELIPGESFTISVDDSSSLEKLTFVKNGAATHSFNMGTKIIELEHQVNADGTITVTLPENANEVTAGSWMLFAWNDEGVPAKAAIIAVNPTQSLYDGIGDLTAEFFTIDAATNSLDQIDFDGTAAHVERVSEINENTGGSFYQGGPEDDFAVRYDGEFETSTTGEYTFNLNSDDGSRLFIDGKQVIDNDGLHGTVEKSAAISLDAGVHKIELIYFERGGGAVVDLDWSGPGFTRKQMKFDGAENNLLVNGGFEMAGLADGYNSFDDIPGWTSSVNNFEINSPGTYGVNPTSGNGFTEIDAGQGEISQTVITEQGRTYELSFDYTGRPNFISTSGMEVLWNGQVITTIEPTNSVWENYSFEMTGTGGADKLSFRSLSGDNDTAGGQLDSVVLTAGPVITPPTPLNTINGTSGDDYLDGTDGDDHFKAGDGIDVMIGGKGNDIFDGEGGDYNQVDFQGNSADYAFTLNGDGSVTVVHAEYGTDTLINVDGAWFVGDNKWYPIDYLIEGIGSEESDQTITGTDGDDYLVGGDGDDIIKGGDGVDVMVGGKGNDSIDGEGGDYNQVDFLGNSTDYTFTRNDDGSVTAQHAEYGTDTLLNIDGAWFVGDEKWLPMSDLAPDTSGGTITGTAGDDYLVGTAGDDIILGGDGNDVMRGGKGDDIYDGQGGDYNQVDFEGKSSDYTFTKNTDGTITAEHAEYGKDILKEIDGVWFSGDEVWQAVDDVVA